jgi:hypothetical protein
VGGGTGRRACSTRSELEKLDARTVTRPDGLDQCAARAHPRHWMLGWKSLRRSHAQVEQTSARALPVSRFAPNMSLPAPPLRAWAAMPWQNCGHTSVSLTSSCKPTLHPSQPVQDARTDDRTKTLAPFLTFLPSLEKKDIRTRGLHVLVTNPTRASIPQQARLHRHLVQHQHQHPLPQPIHQADFVQQFLVLAAAAGREGKGHSRTVRLPFQSFQSPIQILIPLTIPIPISRPHDIRL